MISKTRLDHRAQLLANLIERRIQVLTENLRSPGAPVPFTEQQTNEQALAFWRKNRFTPLGLRLVQQMPPTKVAQLDAWLARNPASPGGEQSQPIPQSPGPGRMSGL